MTKGQLLLVVCIVTISASTLRGVLNARGRSYITAGSQGNRHTESSSIPEAIIYNTLFHYVLDVKAFADEVSREGKDAASLASYFQRTANLTPQQADTLNDVATEIVLEVEQQDTLAREVIDTFQSQFPKGRIPKGVKLPPPPPVLQLMQDRKTAILLKGRDKLRVALGEGGFNNLNLFITTYIAPQMTVTPIR